MKEETEILIEDASQHLIDSGYVQSVVVTAITTTGEMVIFSLGEDDYSQRAADGLADMFDKVIDKITKQAAQMFGPFTDEAIH